MNKVVFLSFFLTLQLLCHDVFAGFFWQNDEKKITTKKPLEVNVGVLFGVGMNGISLGGTANLYRSFTPNIAGFIGMDLVGNPYQFKKIFVFDNNGIKIDARTRTKMDILFRLGASFKVHRFVSVSPYIILGTGFGSIIQDRYDITDRRETINETIIEKKLLLSEYDDTTVRMHYKDIYSDPNKTPSSSLLQNEKIANTFKSKGANFINSHKDASEEFFTTKIPQLNNIAIENQGGWLKMGFSSIDNEILGLLSSASISGFEYITDNYPYNDYGDTTTATGRNAVRTIEAMIVDGNGDHHIYEISDITQDYSYNGRRDKLEYYLIKKDDKQIESDLMVDPSTGFLINRDNPSSMIEKDRDGKLIKYILSQEISNNSDVFQVYVRDNKNYSYKKSFELSELYDNEPYMTGTIYNTDGRIDGADEKLKIVAIDFVENNENKTKYLVFSNQTDEQIKQKIDFYNEIKDNRRDDLEGYNDHEHSSWVEKNEEKEIGRSTQVVEAENSYAIVDSKKIIDQRQKFFFKGGLGLEFTFKDRYFLRFEYRYANLQATNVITYNRTTYSHDVESVYMYGYDIVNNKTRDEYYENYYDVKSGVVFLDAVDNSAKALVTSGDYNYNQGSVETKIDSKMTKVGSEGQSESIRYERHLISQNNGPEQQTNETFTVSKPMTFHMHEFSVGFGLYFWKS